MMEFIDLVGDIIREIASHLTLQDKGFFKATCKTTHTTISGYFNVFVPIKYYYISQLVRRYTECYPQDNYKKRLTIRTKIGRFCLRQKHSDTALREVVRIERQFDRVRWFCISSISECSLYAIAVCHNVVFIFYKTLNKTMDYVRIDYDLNNVIVKVNNTISKYEEIFDRTYFDTLK
jgi:hypothetical protein